MSSAPFLSPHTGECLRIKLLQLCVEVLKAARPTIAANKSLRDGLTKWTWKYLTVPDECPCRCGLWLGVPLQPRLHKPCVHGALRTST